jgi:hypothetical protein
MGWPNTKDDCNQTELPRKKISDEPYVNLEVNNKEQDMYITPPPLECFVS